MAAARRPRARAGSASSTRTRPPGRASWSSARCRPTSPGGRAGRGRSSSATRCSTGSWPPSRSPPDRRLELARRYGPGRFASGRRFFAFTSRAEEAAAFARPAGWAASPASSPCCRRRRRRPRRARPGRWKAATAVLIPESSPQIREEDLEQLHLARADHDLVLPEAALELGAVAAPPAAVEPVGHHLEDDDLVAVRARPRPPSTAPPPGSG